nr:AHH domain-containing protein [Sutcliffiella horikoshii]
MDDINTLRSPNSNWYHKAGAAASLASNFVPGAGVAKFGVKLGAKAISKGAKGLKAKKFVATTVKQNRIIKVKKTVAKVKPIQTVSKSNKRKVNSKAANLRKQGFQEHHIISDKNKLTQNHKLLKEAGFDLQSRSNKMFLPSKASLHPTRSIHKGKHTNKVSENLARQMDQVLEIGTANGWSQKQYNDALRGIISGERQLLRNGSRA